MTNGLQDLNSRTLYTNNDGIAPVPLFKRLHRPCLCTILVTRFWPPEVKNMIPEFYDHSYLTALAVRCYHLSQNFFSEFDKTTKIWCFLSV